METAKAWNKWKEAAELFLKDNKRVVIEDINGNWYFADILFIGEEKLRIVCFGPPQRKDKKFNLYYALINKLIDYQDTKNTKEVEDEMSEM